MTKRDRGAKDPATEPKHLTNKNVRRKSLNAPCAALGLASLINLPTSPPRSKFYKSQTVITFNSMASPPNVGGAKSSRRGRMKRSIEAVEVVSTDAGGLSKKQQLTLYEGGLLPAVVERVLQDHPNNNLPSVLTTPEHVKKFISLEEYNIHHENKRAKQAKNNKEKSNQQVVDTLGSRVKHSRRRL